MEGTDAAKLAALKSSYANILDTVETGAKRDRQSLIKTPERAGKAMLYFTKGYQQTLKGKMRTKKFIFLSNNCPLELVNGAVFDEEHDEYQTKTNSV